MCFSGLLVLVSSAIVGTIGRVARCVISAGPEDRPHSVTVHLFLHAAAGAGSLCDRQISMTVPQGSGPVAVTVSGGWTDSA